MNQPPTEDRRVRRTKSLLHRALASLLHEKSWDDIVVKEILGRADVGRSTFYTHYRDKEALLHAALRETVEADNIEQTPAADVVARVLGFSLPLLEHIERTRTAHRLAVSRVRYTPLHTRLQPALLEIISEELRRATSDRMIDARALPLDLVARQLASTFMVTLEWWVGLEEPRSAREAHDIYLTLARPTVESFIALASR